jgi:hypothetical protein
VKRKDKIGDTTMEGLESQGLVFLSPVPSEKGELLEVYIAYFTRSFFLQAQ